MKKTNNNWSRTPLFHAEKNIIPASTRKHHDMNCWLNTPRLNVGNLQAIKQYWQFIETAEFAQ
ncbi:hypothetical protein [Pseudomonas sp. PDM02]|jgi:hypothetical protein|uniref:hypothetical protein n=1 Tax=unclassified Pseudomonas TaxID=196821 RepID=UPI001783D2D1|nr:hypothetical protein [Pseudomonas sp. PDM02]MBD9614405.1 hypothetical protein [Pseudomonas sp. PDM02]